MNVWNRNMSSMEKLSEALDLDMTSCRRIGLVGGGREDNGALSSGERGAGSRASRDYHDDDPYEDGTGNPSAG